jgi:very-long-chain (3R)-3-hydroxyacyl-CoA dehydratase
MAPSNIQISKVYLLIYNTTCAILWSRILLTTILTLTTSDIASVYTNLEPWTRLAQTLAVAEILHAATGKFIFTSYLKSISNPENQITDRSGRVTGIVRSPVFTTFTQVFARSVQVWAINYAFPGVTAPSLAYPAMLLAWASADTIRYLYFAIMLANYPIPRALKFSRLVWSKDCDQKLLCYIDGLTSSRYSLFTILYPVGISSEWWLMYRATTVTTNWAVASIFYFFLGLYVPGEYHSILNSVFGN